MFDIGFGELAVLVIAALFVFGPDRLPQVTTQAVRALRQLRAMATGAREQLTEAMGPELQDLDVLKDLKDLDVLKDLRDLNELKALRKLDPRSMITSAIFDDGGSVSPKSGRTNGSGAAAAGGAAPSAGAAQDGSASQPAAFDPDAT